MANVSYIRVSHSSQNAQRQREAFPNIKFDKVFEDLGWSGKNTARPQYQAMMQWVRSGDVIYIESLSRISRNVREALEILDDLKKREITLVSKKEDLNTNSPQSMMFVQIALVIAEFERACMLDRQAEGIAIARREGKYQGRKPVDIDKIQLKQYMEQVDNGDISLSKVAKKLNISRPTLYKKIEALKLSEVV